MAELPLTHTLVGAIDWHSFGARGPNLQSRDISCCCRAVNTVPYLRDWTARRQADPRPVRLGRPEHRAPTERRGDRGSTIDSPPSSLQLCIHCESSFTLPNDEVVPYSCNPYG